MIRQTTQLRCSVSLVERDGVAGMCVGPRLCGHSVHPRTVKNAQQITVRIGRMEAVVDGGDLIAAVRAAMGQEPEENGQ